ncbi:MULTISPECIES: CdaR family protein [Ruminococcus]|uniref:YbbR domain-containing protein n=1 Tax=Ruminococcus flavefaciens TaxID=1265 RepID=A0A1M7M391_RUMFL|nr:MULTISPECIES: hypothetical protein [Ruminococcus]MCR4793948.1 hypothetical protein [Ruminococcus sp.]SHM85140.1 hypothetical protein SAMN04487860_11832 [Ruminococcus flavefaciens]
MTLFNSNKKRSKNEAKSNLVLFIIALICAIAGWFIISMKIYPSVSVSFANIPVELDTNGTDAGANGLQPITPKQATVRVSFDCTRTDYAKIRRDTIVASIDYSGIVNGGTKELTVKVKNTKGVTMSHVHVVPSTISVDLDKFETNTFVVKPSLPKITTAEGMAYDETEVICDPVEVKIKAPSRTLAKIAECYAVYDKQDTLDRETIINSDKFRLLTENGAEIVQDENIKIEPSSVSMTIPVFTQKTVKLGVNLIKPPQNFDQDCLHFVFTPDTVTIAAKNADSNIPDPLQIPINLSSLDIGYSFDYDLDKLLAPNNLKNVSGIDKVNISLVSDGLASKELTLNGDDISIINKPNDNNEYTNLTDQLTVKIVGPEDIINDITAKDLSAAVDLLGADTSKEQFKYNVNVSCKTHNNVWAAEKDLKVTILKTSKDGSTTKNTSSPTVTTTY